MVTAYLFIFFFEQIGWDQRSQPFHKVKLKPKNRDY